MAVLAGKGGAEHQLFAGAGVQLHLGVGDDIADVAQQQDGLTVLTVIELFAALEKNPKAMRLAEARLLELLGADSAPALFATAGSASAPATVREKPKTIDEASGLARAAFGV